MTIKTNRAQGFSKIGMHPAKVAAMLSHVDRQVLASVSSRTLASVIDSLYAASLAAKAIAMRDAIGEGAVWDAKAQRHRDIV